MPDEFKRFAQSARKSVRGYVAHHREPPPLIMLASKGADPRRLQAYRIGAAHDAAEIKQITVDAIREEGAHYAAIVSQLRDRITGGRLHCLGLVAVAPFDMAAWAVLLEQGKKGLTLGGWEESPELLEPDYAFVQQAVRSCAHRGA
jgi:hypothetical protein